MVMEIIIIGVGVVGGLALLWLMWCIQIAIEKRREGKKIERQLRSMRELETSLMDGVFEANKKAKEAEPENDDE